MKHLGKFNLIQDNEPCTLPRCKCGWNIQIGGRDTKDYKWLKKIFKEREE